MTPLFKKIMALVRKTGDRCILFDSGSDEAFVLMDFAAYEAFLDKGSDQVFSSGRSHLTELTSQDKIKPVTEFSVNSDKEAIPPVEIDSFAEPSEENIIEDERFYLEPLE